MLGPEKMDELIWASKPGSGPAAKVLREIREMAERNRAALLEEWENKVCHDD